MPNLTARDWGEGGGWAASPEKLSAPGDISELGLTRHQQADRVRLENRWPAFCATVWTNSSSGLPVGCDATSRPWYYRNKSWRRGICYLLNSFLGVTWIHVCYQVKLAIVTITYTQRYLTKIHAFFICLFGKSIWWGIDWKSWFIVVSKKKKKKKINVVLTSVPAPEALILSSDWLEHFVTVLGEWLTASRIILRFEGLVTRVCEERSLWSKKKKKRSLIQPLRFIYWISSSMYF